MIISKEFYNRSALDVAQDLLGKVLVREVDGKILKGKIVETEAYIGAIDKACHAYNGRRTKRTEILYEDAGVSYIYFIYGLYHCFNVVTNKKDVAEAVLWLDDEWTVVTADKSLAAHYENTVLVTKNGPEILSLVEE